VKLFEMCSGYRYKSYFSVMPVQYYTGDRYNIYTGCRYDIFMMLILSYFAKSGDKRAELAEVQKEMGSKEMCMVKFHAIRWLSRASVLTRLVSSYGSLRVQWDRHMGRLAQDTRMQTEPAGLCRLSDIIQATETHKYIGSLAGIHDVLYQQAEVNKAFQAKNLRFKTVTALITKTVSELKSTYLDSNVVGGTVYMDVHRCMRESRRNLADAIASSGKTASEHVQKISTLLGSQSTSFSESGPGLSSIRASGGCAGPDLQTQPQSLTILSKPQLSSAGRFVRPVETFRFSSVAGQQQQLQAGIRKSKSLTANPQHAGNSELKPGFYYVEKVVDERQDGKVYVKWKDSDDSHNTWENVQVEEGD
jgi:hypothetical protein